VDVDPHFGESLAAPLFRETEGALLAARSRAVKYFAAWLMATSFGFSVLYSFGPSLGWPSGGHPVKGHVVEIRPVSDGEVVFWEAVGPEGRVYWSNHLDEDHEWDLGDPIDGWITDDARFYMQEFASWMGPAGGYLWFMVLITLLFVGRRLLGIVIALWDLRTGRDRPRRGYVALIENPLPKTWRPLVLIWWDDPTDGEKAPFPDVTFLADDVTGEHLKSGVQMRVLEAEVDTGRFSWMKPRWIAVTGGVLVPHRRALLAGALSTSETRGWTNKKPVRLKSDGGAPEETGQLHPRWSDGFAAMVLIRVGAVAALALVSFFIAEGHPVTLV